jgi:hypothetical protein
MGSSGFNQGAGAGTYVLASWLFLRLLGVIYLVAFISLATQIQGLVGRDGILPISEFFERRRVCRFSHFYRLPTLCWFNASDLALKWLAWTGAGLSLLLVIGFAPLPVLALLWLVYLSLFNVCGIFLGYQWDVLLLETGFLAMFLAPIRLVPQFPPVAAPSPIILWLLWWLLFRLMFSSGMVKLASGDLTWRRLTALRFHYETQPLPTPLAWYAHKLPALSHKISAVIMFGIELLAPFLIIAPAPVRPVAAFLFIALMALIQLTGNYSFFNLLGIALSVLLLDDAFLFPAFHWLFPHAKILTIIPAPEWLNWIGGALAILILTLSLPPMFRLFRYEVNWPRALITFFELFEPFRLVNSYGLFSLMATERPEIIVEGSDDAATWHEYEFKWKPGDVKRVPRFVAPHQPRLDWQMWFAALGYFPNNPWFGRFLMRLLEGSPSVLSLLRTNPFPKSPPRYIRGVLYDYRFTNRAQLRATGDYWRRERRGSYCPILELGRHG